jgi:hypothetical protein
VPFVLPPASFLGCRYDMPSQLVDWLSKLFTVRTGNLKCAINVKADQIPPHTAQPPPPPPVATTINAPAGSLTNAEGTWTFGTDVNASGNAILLNGTHVAGAYGVTMTVASGVLYHANTQGIWWKWINGGWQPAPAP